ncbi:phage tail tape measure protein [Pseudomonas shahriarae]|uniref:Phage tail tape measure protein n=1 Tax=Pseudomonas shahriarae TaxID=2745512 RepID=A0ABT5NDK1_9PSED|nr:phage tail tape measure protein [Pseudomonas shahriarae]MDD0985810.1 phage tail tape measure protein [Pseudomonas shahriarae]MDD1032748.1 phage tail tape measure protein [Pseudomonas shahriarae]
MAVDSLGQLTVDLVANTGGFEKGMDRAERKLKSTTKEAAYQAKELDKLVGRIDPVVAAYSRLDKMEEQLQAHRKAGRLPTAEFDLYKKKIDEQRASIEQTDKVMLKNGQTAKQYAANLRGVPAQFTDIAVSLQAGQNPMTVFLQQGGQLKDMFGGIGPAAQALGGYVLGLINPFTVAAAAAAVLALAYKQGSDEATAYTTSLAMTGNTVGTTAGQLSTLAQQIALANGTIGKASGVLAQLAGSTRIPIQAFEGIAAAAIRFESATGQAAEETVKNFEKIAKDPAAEILKLNESMNFLTATTYEQIKALQAQGKTQEAAALANDTYEQGLNRTSDSIKKNLGLLEGSWSAVKNAAKEAWDAALNIGREDTLDQQIAALDKQLNDIANARKLNKSDGFDNLVPNDSFRVEALEAEKTQKLVLKAEEDRRAAARGFQQQQQQQALSDQVSLDKLRKETETNADKRARELGEYRMLVERRIIQARASGDKSLLISPEQQTKDIANINDKYKDPKVARTPLYREDAGSRALDQARQQYAVLQRQNGLIGDQSAASQTLGANAKKLVEFEQQLADIKAKKTLTADQRSLLASQDLITAQLKRNAALEAENTLREKGLETQKKLAAFDENLKSQLSSAQQGLDNNLAGIGLGDEQRKRLQEQRGIQQSYQSQMDKLTSDYNKSSKDQFSTELYNKETQALKSALDQRLAMQNKFYEDEDQARSDWSLGASSAFQNYMDQAKDVAGQTQSAFTSLYDGLTDAAVDWAFGADQSFGDVAKSFAKMIAKMALQSAASNVFASIAGSAIGSAFGGGGGAAVSAGSTAAGYSADVLSKWPGLSDGGWTGPGGKYEPKGVVHGDEFVIRKEVVQQPGMRGYLERLNKKGYADGGYVGLSGGSSSAPTAPGGVVIQQSFVVQGAESGTSQKDSQALGQAYADIARRGAQAEIAKETQPGGQIWRLVNGR